MFSDERDCERADWPLLRDGAVTLFRRREVLDETIESLDALSYAIREIECGAGLGAFRQQMSDMLRWQEQFGYEPWSGNLDALNDGFREFPFGETNRSALVLWAFHAIVRADPDRARTVLDIVARAARDHLLRGRTLIALVQTDDPGYECRDLGGRAALWNPRESLRRLKGVRG